MQEKLFYEGPIEALNRTVKANHKGLSIKQIAGYLWPARNPDTARSVLSRCLNEETDVHLDFEEIVKVMEVTETPEHIIFCLCDTFGFERPAKKNREDFKREIKTQIEDVSNILRALTDKVARMEALK